MGTKERSVKLFLFSLLGSGTVGIRALTGGAAVDVFAMVVDLIVFFVSGSFHGNNLGCVKSFLW